MIVLPRASPSEFPLKNPREERVKQGGPGLAVASRPLAVSLFRAEFSDRSRRLTTLGNHSRQPRPSVILSFGL
ncbi:MAG: hypothetical protein CMH76_00565 [Nitrospinae bacterium]|nr:hypothetical protein [Nitrospinota bacterium]